MKDKRIYLVDSGLVLNSPYPLVLRPERDVDIFLSFDFSARDKDDEMPFQVTELDLNTLTLISKSSTGEIRYWAGQHPDVAGSVRNQDITRSSFLIKGPRIYIFTWKPITIDM